MEAEVEDAERDNVAVEDKINIEDNNTEGKHRNTAEEI